MPSLPTPGRTHSDRGQGRPPPPTLMPSPAVGQWRAALAGTGAIHFAMKGACEAAAAAELDVRLWAADLSPGTGGSCPKFFIAATADDFIAAYLRLPPSSRHAYEIIASACYLYFDLDARVEAGWEHAAAVAECALVVAAASDVLSELAAMREPGSAELVIDSLVLDATRAGKVSRHIVCRSTRGGAPWLLRNTSWSQLTCSMASLGSAVGIRLAHALWEMATSRRRSFWGRCLTPSRSQPCLRWGSSERCRQAYILYIYRASETKV